MRRFFALLTGCLLVTCLSAQETLIIQETFDNNDRGWPIYKEKSYSTQLKKGKYIMKANVEDKTYWFFKYFSQQFNTTNDNFTVECSFTLIKGDPNTPFGLISSMYNDQSNYVKFLVSNTGYYKIVHYYNETNHEFREWTTHPAVHTSGTQKLRIERSFNVCRYYINNVMVYEGADITYYGHGFGFQLNGKSEVHVDDFILKSSPKQHNLVDDAIQERVKERLSENINSQYDELSPVISYDGKTLYICRDGHPQNYGKDDNDVWVSEWEDGDWGYAYNINKPVNNSGQNFVVTVSPDNNTMYIGNTYNADGSSAGSGLSVTHRTLNGWEVPTDVFIEEYSNSDDYVSYFLASDNKILLLAINDGESHGLKDLYISFIQEDGSFSKPVNMGTTVNTSGQEFNPVLAADNKTMYFCSYGHDSYGSADIYITRRLDDSWTNWSEPQNLGPEINTTDWDGKISISARGDYAYIVSAEGSENNTSDVFRVKLGEARPDPVLLIYGKVLNRKTGEPLAASITYNDLENNEQLGTAISNPKDGSYKIILPLGKAYSFLAERNDFYPISENISVENLEGYTELQRDLYLAPVEVGETVRLNNLFFEYDKADLKNESEAELMRLVKFLEENPGVHIQVSGHTDDQGPDAYNLTLSQKRVNAVTDFLVSNGIAAARLKGTGYGETKPLVLNTTEENRAKNRRVEFTIVKK